MEKRKISFFKRVWRAITNFDEYKEFVLDKIGINVLYFIKLILIFSIVVSIAYIIKIYPILNEAINYVRNDLPDFAIREGKLDIQLDDTIVLENDKSSVNVVMIIPSKKEDLKNEFEKINLYDTGLMFFYDKILLKTPTGTLNENSIGYGYNDIGIIKDITKEEIIKTIDDNRVSSYISIYFISVISSFCVYLILGIIDVVTLALLGFLLARLSRLSLKLKATMSLAIYSLTLPILLNAIYISTNMITGIGIKYFDIAYSIISYIYLITAIMLIRGEIIKRNFELTMVIKEEQRIKEEQERKKEEEKEQEQEEKGEKMKKEKEKEEKEEKEKKENQNPEGSKA